MCCDIFCMLPVFHIVNADGMAATLPQAFGNSGKTPASFRVESISIDNGVEPLLHMPLNIIGQHAQEYTGANTLVCLMEDRASKNDRQYACGTNVSAEDLQRLRIIKADFHPEWNYGIRLHAV